LLVRNKNFVEREKKPKPKGEVLEMTTDEVRRFCNENKDDERLNIAHIREVLPAPGEVDETKKFFGFINNVGGISGVACVLEGRGGSAMLHRLATTPSLQSLGVGGAMIEFLKEQYKSINLVPTPEGIIKGDTGDPFEDLRQFYIRRGFVPGMPFVWQEDWINLNDTTNPGEWREFNEAKNLLVFDGFKLKGDEVSDVFLSEVWRNNRNEIIGEARDGLDWFMEVRSQIKRDQAKLKRLREERQRQ
jgi:GNAT superfamily N-acetyltransferase